MTSESEGEYKFMTSRIRRSEKEVEGKKEELKKKRKGILPDEMEE